jgi:hypothetical protein
MAKRHFAQAKRSGRPQADRGAGGRTVSRAKPSLVETPCGVPLPRLSEVRRLRRGPLGGFPGIGRGCVDRRQRETCPGYSSYAAATTSRPLGWLRHYPGTHRARRSSASNGVWSPRVDDLASQWIGAACITRPGARLRVPQLAMAAARVRSAEPIEQLDFDYARGGNMTCPLTSVATRPCRVQMPT